MVEGGLHIHLNCDQGVEVVEGRTLHVHLFIHLNCVHRQIHICDAMGSLVLMMLYARWP